MATITGGSGDDSLTGTSGDDTIIGGAGADSIDAGAGNDSIVGNDGLDSADGGDTIDAGDGNDTILADGGDDVLSGGAGVDSIHGGSGNDWVDGGADGDILYGDDGADTIMGGDGDDLIYAGAGNDVIGGGSGSDTLYGHGGADVFVVSANSGTNYIEDYNAGDGDIIAINYPGITNYAELQPYLSDDGNFGTLISLPDGSVTQVKWLNYNTQSASNFTFESSPICFTPGTLIETDAGLVPVEDLAVGDRVLTLDNGFEPVRWTGRRSFSAAELTRRPELCPVRIRASAMAPGWPAADLVVSPQHRVLVSHACMAILHAEAQVLVAAEHLIDGRGITREPAGAGVTYIHFMFDRHEVVLSNGAWSESFNADRRSMGLVGEAQRAEILAIFPGLARAGGGLRYRPTVRPVIKGHEIASLARDMRWFPGSIDGSIRARA